MKKKWMMIEGLSDEQKSVLLARAMGWCWRRQSKVDGFTRNWWHLLDKDKKRIKRTQVHWVTEKNDGRPVPGRWQDRYVPNLYDPANMALAYRVRQWADELMANGLDRPDDFDAIDLAWNQVHLLPTKWLRGWLDAIFMMVEDTDELAIEAGLVEVDDVE